MKKSSKIAAIVVLVLIAVVAGAIYYLSSNVDRIERSRPWAD
jgi:ABC-type thiamin/hydroxymethylpyrimidine transport system permease subunit